MFFRFTDEFHTLEFRYSNDILHRILFLDNSIELIFVSFSQQKRKHERN